MWFHFAFSKVQHRLNFGLAYVDTTYNAPIEKIHSVWYEYSNKQPRNAENYSQECLASDENDTLVTQREDGFLRKSSWQFKCMKNFYIYAFNIPMIFYNTSHNLHLHMLFLWHKHNHYVDKYAFWIHGTKVWIWIIYFNLMQYNRLFAALIFSLNLSILFCFNNT